MFKTTNTQTSEFKIILAAGLISQMGSHLLTISLAAYVLKETGSPLFAAIIFVLSTFPAVLFSSYMGAWIHRTLSKWLLIKADAISAVMSVLCGFSFMSGMPVAITGVLLSFRSIFMFITRSGSLRWIKEISPQSDLAVRIKVYYLTFFISTALAGVFGAILLRNNSLTMVIVADVITYIFSILCLLNLNLVQLFNEQEQKKTTQNPLSVTMKILKNPKLAQSFSLVCFSQGIFQGAYTSMVTSLPISKFGMAIFGIGYFQVAASLGITLGFLIIWKNPNLLRNSKKILSSRNLIFGVLALISMLVCEQVNSLFFSLAAFCLLNFFYECIWLYHSTEFFQEIPKEHAAQYQFTLSAVAALLMAAVTLVFSSLSSEYGLSISTLIFTLLGFITWVMIFTVQTMPFETTIRRTNS